MATTKTYPRLNIYLNGRSIHEVLKIAAARKKVSLSEYCLEAIRKRLEEEGYIKHRSKAKQSARRMDKIRKHIGPIGIPVRELIEQGRRR